MELPTGFFAWLLENNGTISLYKQKGYDDKEIQHVRITVFPRFMEQSRSFMFELHDYHMESIEVLNKNLLRVICEVQKELVFAKDERQGIE